MEVKKLLKFNTGCLRNWRKNNRLSQAQVAEKIGRSAATISKWELGTTSIPMQDFVRVLSLFEANIDEAFCRPLVNDDGFVERPEAEGKDEK